MINDRTNVRNMINCIVPDTLILQELSIHEDLKVKLPMHYNLRVTNDVEWFDNADTRLTAALSIIDTCTIPIYGLSE